MANPFDDPNGSYLVLINDEGQHSLWPAFVDIPAGWQVIHGEAGRQDCLDFVERSWTDMRPQSLIDAMAAANANGAAGPLPRPADGSLLRETPTPAHSDARSSAVPEGPLR
jgi:MbtH protein